MGNDVKTEIEKITPELAAIYLKKNTSNRPIRGNTVKAYASEIKRGAWVVNGEAIKFDTDGKLIDGQHRLNAVIMAGISIDSLVVRGINHQAFDTLDVGAKRSAKDVLSLSGHKNCATLAAAAKILFLFKKTSKFNLHRTDIVVTNRDILEFCEQRSLLEICASYVNSRNQLKKLAGSGGVLCAMHYLFLMANEEKCFSFLESLESGANLGINHPILALRAKLFEESSRNYRTAGELIALYIKAWNAFLINKEIKQLRFSASEEFPKILKLPSKW